MTRCDRCGRVIPEGRLAYHVWIWVVARIDESLPQGLEADLQEVVGEAADYYRGMSEVEVASDVHCQRSYLVCSLCKEELLANPLGRSPGDPMS